MTFVMTVIGEHSLWMVAGMRLSRIGRPIRDNAVEILSLVFGKTQAMRRGG